METELGERGNGNNELTAAIIIQPLPRVIKTLELHWELLTPSLTFSSLKCCVSCIAGWESRASVTLCSEHFNISPSQVAAAALA